MQPRVDPFRLVADALGVPYEIAHLVPVLFADFQALGGWPDDVVALMAETASVSSDSRVVDLGCGKGAAALALARTFGCRVVGVDLYEPFLEAARVAALEAGVSHLCDFRLQDIHDAVQEPSAFDVSVFGAVGTVVFGSVADCVGAIRRCVRPGGCLVIVDGYMKPEEGNGVRFTGYEYYESREAVLPQLAAHGDVVEREVIIPDDRIERESEAELVLLSRRTDELKRRFPALSGALDEFMARQRAEYEFVHGRAVEVIWLVRRV